MARSVFGGLEVRRAGIGFRGKRVLTSAHEIVHSEQRIEPSLLQQEILEDSASLRGVGRIFRHSTISRLKATDGDASKYATAPDDTTYRNGLRLALPSVLEHLGSVVFYRPTRKE